LPSAKRKPDVPRLENLIVDEASMLDLGHMATLCRALELQGLASVRRFILVGDEHQLPPIGCGRPLFDILEHLWRNPGKRAKHLVQLNTNCRQSLDPEILAAAELFTEESRFGHEMMHRLVKGGRVSTGLEVVPWSTTSELHTLVAKQLYAVLDREGENEKEWPGTVDAQFNLLLGLYDNGFVPAGARDKWSFDRLQILAPYRAGGSGTLGLNGRIRAVFRSTTWPPKSQYERYWRSNFGHAEKIIRIKNYYRWPNGRPELTLPNGAIGVLNNHLPKKGNGAYRAAYFKESEDRIYWDKVDEDDFELAYAITVHKAQGSEFGEVFLVLPQQRALLSRELVYTAMTRSQGALSIFVQTGEGQSLFEHSRRRVIRAALVLRMNRSFDYQLFRCPFILTSRSTLAVSDTTGSILEG
jgi:ATP-dependent exoDNAse (exonuclease V) alpha subunit